MRSERSRRTPSSAQARVDLGALCWEEESVPHQASQGLGIKLTTTLPRDPSLLAFLLCDPRTGHMDGFGQTHSLAQYTNTKGPHCVPAVLYASLQV